MPGRNGPVEVSRSAERVAWIALQLGHGDVVVQRTPTGSKWTANCVCGWRGTGVVLQVEAVKKARHHLARAVLDLERWAHSHGHTLNEALSEFAVDQLELAERIHDRVESRHASE